MIKKLWITIAVAGAVLFAAVKSHAEERQCPIMTYGQAATGLDAVKKTMSDVDATLADGAPRTSRTDAQRRIEFLDLMAYCLRKQEADRQEYIKQLINGVERPQ